MELHKFLIKTGIDMLKKPAKKPASKTPKQLIAENKKLRMRLEESEEILNAIRSGEVDAMRANSAAAPERREQPPLVLPPVP